MDKMPYGLHPIDIKYNFILLHVLTLSIDELCDKLSISIIHHTIAIC